MASVVGRVAQLLHINGGLASVQFSAQCPGRALKCSAREWSLTYPCHEHDRLEEGAPVDVQVPAVLQEDELQLHEVGLTQRTVRGLYFTDQGAEGAVARGRYQVSRKNILQYRRAKSFVLVFFEERIFIFSLVGSNLKCGFTSETPLTCRHPWQMPVFTTRNRQLRHGSPLYRPS